MKFYRIIGFLVLILNLLCYINIANEGGFSTSDREKLTVIYESDNVKGKSMISKIFYQFSRAFIDKFVLIFFDHIMKFYNNMANLRDFSDNIESIGVRRVPLALSEDIQREVNEYVSFLIKCIKSGVQLQSLALSGPPGTGKSQISVAIAKSLSAALESPHIPLRMRKKVTTRTIMGAMLSKFDHSTAMNVIENLRKETEELSKKGYVVMIQFDEMEAVFSSRKTGSSQKNEMISSLLAWLGQAKANLFVVGTTNLMSSLDDAMRRRFHKNITVSAPDFEARIKIIQIYLQYFFEQFRGQVKISINVLDLEFLSGLSESCNNLAGADIENIVKKGFDSASVGDGFVSRALIREAVIDELFKKATFGRDLVENEVEEIKHYLGKGFFSWINDVTPYYVLLSHGVDYNYDFLQRIGREVSSHSIVNNSNCYSASGVVMNVCNSRSVCRISRAINTCKHYNLLIKKCVVKSKSLVLYNINKLNYYQYEIGNRLIFNRFKCESHEGVIPRIAHNKSYLEDIALAKV